MSKVVKYIDIENSDLITIFGVNDSLLNMIESKFGSTIFIRGNQIIISGEEAEIKALEAIFKELQYLVSKNGVLSEVDVKTAIQISTSDKADSEILSAQSSDNVIYKGVNSQIRGKTKTQIEYFQKVKKNDMQWHLEN
jgi:phosphate starvation-inducible PhoH-like protein